MKISVYLSGNNEEHDIVLRAFFNGIKKKYDNATIALLNSYDDSNRPDLAVVFGVEKKAVPDSQRRGKVIRLQQQLGQRKVIVLEKGYIKRDIYYAAGFDGLNGRADFRNKNSPSDRARLIDIELEPWKKNGNHIIICGQVPWDAAVQHTNHIHWIQSTIEHVRARTNRPIIFRGHPLARKAYPKFPVDADSYSPQLEDDLKNAYCVITFNSNSAVEAAINGVPVIFCDEGSMAQDVGNKLENLNNLAYPDRTQWLNNIAYSQWSIEEMAQGLAFSHLSKHLN